MFDFPASPSIGQIYAPAGGPSYIWDGTKWKATGSSGTTLAATAQGNILVRNSAGAGPFEQLKITDLPGLSPPGQSDVMLGYSGTGTGQPRAISAGSISGLSGVVHPQGRLTLTASSPVMNADVAGGTTIRYTSYLGYYVPIYLGSGVPQAQLWGSGDLTQLLTDATKSPAAAVANSNYDIFLWMDAGTPRISRGPPWTSDTARGTGAGTTELVRPTGIAIYLNANAITNGPVAQRGTYLGTIRTNASATCDFISGGVGNGGVQSVLGIWNAYNRIVHRSNIFDNTSYTSIIGGSWQAMGANNKINWVRGLDEDMVEAEFYAPCQPGASSDISVSIGISAAAGPMTAIGYSNSATMVELHAIYRGYLGIGYRSIIPIARVLNGANAGSVFGSSTGFSLAEFGAQISY